MSSIMPYYISHESNFDVDDVIKLIRTVTEIIRINNKLFNAKNV